MERTTVILFVFFLLSVAMCSLHSFSSVAISFRTQKYVNTSLVHRLSPIGYRNYPLPWAVTSIDEIPPNAVRRKIDRNWRGGFSLGVDLGLSRTGIAISKGYTVKPLTVTFEISRPRCVFKFSNEVDMNWVLLLGFEIERAKTRDQAFRNCWRRRGWWIYNWVAEIFWWERDDSIEQNSFCCWTARYSSRREVKHTHTHTFIYRWSVMKLVKFCALQGLESLCIWWTWNNVRSFR